MIRHLILAALLSPLPTLATAQAPICDGSEIRRLERRRQFGAALSIGWLVGSAIVFGRSLGSPTPEGAQTAIENGRRAMNFALITLPVAAIGSHIYLRSHPGEAFWAETIARAKVAQTTTADVRSCLGLPPATSIAGAEERWTYFTTRPDAWSRRSLGTASFTFTNGVLTEVRRSQVRLPPAWPSSEPTPAVVPVP